MAAKLLKCEEDDLVHFAANGKLKIHMLTDGLSYAVESDYLGEQAIEDQAWMWMPKTVPVCKQYWIDREAGSNGFFGVIMQNNNGTMCHYSPPFFDSDYSTLLLPNKLVILHDELMNIAKDSAIPKTNTDLSDTERNFMLKLIIGMAIDGYGYDPNATRNKATGNNNGSIKAALDELGLRADEKTISKYLKLAAESYPEAKPRKP